MKLLPSSEKTVECLGNLNRHRLGQFLPSRPADRRGSACRGLETPPRWPTAAPAEWSMSQRAAETDTPWIPIARSASAALRASRAADSQKVPNRLRSSSATAGSVHHPFATPAASACCAAATPAPAASLKPISSSTSSSAGDRRQHVELIDVAHVRQPPDLALQRVLAVGQLEAVLLLQLRQRHGAVHAGRHLDHRQAVGRRSANSSRPIASHPARRPPPSSRAAPRCSRCPRPASASGSPHAPISVCAGVNGVSLFLQLSRYFFRSK